MKTPSSGHQHRFSQLCVVLSMGLLLTGCPALVTIINSVGGVPSLANGLAIEVVSVEFPDDLRPEVLFRIKDSGGNDVALSELTDARFILAYLEEAPTGSTPRYISYITRTENPDGVPNSGDEAVQSNYDGARLNGITDHGNGTYTYKFSTAVPADFDPSLTHQLAGQFERRYPIDGLVYPFNLVSPFRPDGGVVTATREIVNTATCNSCHTRLELHGGARREMQLCIMCHSTQSTDGNTGNSVDFPEMIHKIHMGAELPSVQAGDPYQIIGFGNSVHDYSTVHFPQDIRNCEVCHDGAPQSDVFMTNPTAAGCVSCHDRTWLGNPDNTPEGWEDHTGGQQVNDSLCATCHKPTGPAPSPIFEAHRIVSELPENRGLVLDVVAVSTTPPAKQEEGVSVTVSFSALYADGSPVESVADLNSIATTIGYPAAEYETVLRESINAASPNLVNNGGGNYDYTFNATLPAGSTETFAAAMEGRIQFTHEAATFRQGTTSNGILYFTLDESAAVPRREIVSDAKCAACHSTLHFHGDNRVGVMYCVVCHNPGATDVARRPAELLPPETINFKDMIHRIHSGEELEMDYTVYGFGNTPHDFTEVRFPGDRSQCTICHNEGTYGVPVAEEAQSTMVSDAGEIVRDILPERAACTSCHDGLLPNVHAILSSDLNARVESCAVCHGSGSDFAVQAIHAMAP